MLRAAVFPVISLRNSGVQSGRHRGERVASGPPHLTYCDLL
jgi:hypothetical protein